MEKAGGHLIKMSRLFKSHNLKLRYQCKTSALLCVLPKISWVDSNETVLERMRKEKEVMNTIKRKKLDYL